MSSLLTLGVNLSYAWLVALCGVVLASPICFFIPFRYAALYGLAFIGVVAAGLGPPLGFWFDGETVGSLSPPNLLPAIWYAPLSLAALLALAGLFRLGRLSLARALVEIGIVVGPMTFATLFAFASHRQFAELYKSSVIDIAAGRPFCLLPSPDGGNGKPQISVHKLFAHAGYPNIDGIYGYYSTMWVGDEAYNWSFRRGAFVPMSATERREFRGTIPCAPDRTSFGQ
jgi:hypothetical protein